MSIQANLSRPAVLATYAGADLSKWQVIVGREIVHGEFGVGHVTRVYMSDFGFRVRATFQHLDKSPERPFEYGAFLNGTIQDVSLPADFRDLDTFAAEHGDRLLALQRRLQRQIEIKSWFLERNARPA